MEFHAAPHNCDNCWEFNGPIKSPCAKVLLCNPHIYHNCTLVYNFTKYIRNFQNSSTGSLSSECAIKWILKIPPCLPWCLKWLRWSVRRSRVGPAPGFPVPGLAGRFCVWDSRATCFEIMSQAGKRVRRWTLIICDRWLILS